MEKILKGVNKNCFGNIHVKIKEMEKRQEEADMLDIDARMKAEIEDSLGDQSRIWSSML